MIPIFLVGYMGVGKSTLGRKLATELGLRFLDTDLFIESRFRESIATQFERVGEEVFRQREQYVIEELSGMTDCVIATGGGLPCFNGNMTLMNTCGITIYLHASDPTIAQRLERTKRTRPSVRDKSGAELLEHITLAMRDRRPIYETAHIRLSIEGASGEDDEWGMAKILAKRIRNHIKNKNKREL